MIKSHLYYSITYRVIIFSNLNFIRRACCTLIDFSTQLRAPSIVFIICNRYECSWYSFHKLKLVFKCTFVGGLLLETRLVQVFVVTTNVVLEA